MRRKPSRLNTRPPAKTLFGRFFRYLEPMWLGNNGEISVRSVLAIAFSINLMINTSRALTAIIRSGSSVADMGLILGIEGGLIAALLALKTYQNAVETRVEAETDPPPEMKGD